MFFQPRYGLTAQFNEIFGFEISPVIIGNLASEFRQTYGFEPGFSDLLLDVLDILYPGLMDELFQKFQELGFDETDFVINLKSFLLKNIDVLRLPPEEIYNFILDNLRLFKKAQEDTFESTQALLQFYIAQDRIDQIFNNLYFEDERFKRQWEELQNDDPIKCENIYNLLLTQVFENPRISDAKLEDILRQGVYKALSTKSLSEPVFRNEEGEETVLEQVLPVTKIDEPKDILLEETLKDISSDEKEKIIDILNQFILSGFDFKGIKDPEELFNYALESSENAEELAQALEEFKTKKKL